MLKPNFTTETRTTLELSVMRSTAPSDPMHVIDWITIAVTLLLIVAASRLVHGYLDLEDAPPPFDGDARIAVTARRREDP